MKIAILISALYKYYYYYDNQVKSGEEAESKMDRTDEQRCFGVQEKRAGACFFRESSLQREWKEKRIY